MSLRVQYELVEWDDIVVAEEKIQIFERLRKEEARHRVLGIRRFGIYVPQRRIAAWCARLLL